MGEVKREKPEYWRLLRNEKLIHREDTAKLVSQGDGVCLAYSRVKRLGQENHV